MGGGSLSKIHLIKMLYAADKDQLKTTGMPITGDVAYSLRNGPILSGILNFLNKDTAEEFWDSHFSAPEEGSHLITLLNPVSQTLLTSGEKESLARAFTEFSKLSIGQLIDRFHDPDRFPEWTDPGYSSTRITFEQMLGNREQAEDLRQLQDERRLFDRITG
jgi:hypothetical protein